MSVRRICIMGFMGAGKSRRGKQLANKLGMTFIDLDKAIEAKAGMPVSRMFEKNGEDFFRRLETETLRDILLKENVVISLGGGTPCNDVNLSLIKQNAFSIYLKANAGMLHSRLKNDFASRPLLAGKQPDELLPFIQDLLAQREPYYHQADATVEVEGLTIEKLAAAVQSTR